MTPSEALRWVLSGSVRLDVPQARDALREALAIVESVQSTRDTFHTSHGAAWAAGYHRGHGDGVHDAQGWARRISINPWNGELAGRYQVVETGRSRSDVPNVANDGRAETLSIADDVELINAQINRRLSPEVPERLENVGADGYHPPAFPGALSVKFSEGGWRGSRPNVQSLPRPPVAFVDAELLRLAAERGTPELGAEAFAVYCDELGNGGVPWTSLDERFRQAWRHAAQKIWEMAR